MKDLRRGVRWSRFVMVSVCLLCPAGCEDRSVSQAERNFERQYAADYQQQKDILEKQNAEWARQVEKIEEQDARYDAILAKWEKQAERVDALLGRWDRILGVLEKRSGDR